jgi:asparaginyl-tRNA synthetase
MEAAPPATPELADDASIPSFRGEGDQRHQPRTLIRAIVGAIDAHDKKRVVVGGWVRTGRRSSSLLAFLELNDGSCQQNLQAVVKGQVYGDLRRLTPTGTSVLLEGVLEKLDGAKHKQLIELQVERVIDVGEVDARVYPLPKTKHTLEGLRDIPHLRPRTDTVSVSSLLSSTDTVVLLCRS